MKVQLLKSVFLFMFLGIFLSCDNEDDPEELQLPEITTVVDETEAVVTHTSVEIQGMIVESDSEISSYGVVWGTNSSPTLEDNVAFPEGSAAATKSNRKQSQDLFVVKITDLTPGHTYYFRTFATNQAGTAYGEELTVDTPGLAETKWEITFHHNEEISWIAEVEYFEDGNAFYTEPEYPGIYDQWGEWSMEDNVLTYDLMVDDEGESYILTGELTGNEMSGTYTFNTSEGMTHRPWTGIKLPSEAN
jgi:hypothetical protein